jgi:hypothetical protein
MAVGFDNIGDKMVLRVLFKDAEKAIEWMKQLSSVTLANETFTIKYKRRISVPLYDESNDGLFGFLSSLLNCYVQWRFRYYVSWREVDVVLTHNRVARLKWLLDAGGDSSLSENLFNMKDKHAGDIKFESSGVDLVAIATFSGNLAAHQWKRKLSKRMSQNTSWFCSCGKTDVEIKWGTWWLHHGAVIALQGLFTVATIWLIAFISVAAWMKRVLKKLTYQLVHKKPLNESVVRNPPMSRGTYVVRTSIVST